MKVAISRTATLKEIQALLETSVPGSERLIHLDISADGQIVTEDRLLSTLPMELEVAPKDIPNSMLHCFLSVLQDFRHLLTDEESRQQIPDLTDPKRQQVLEFINELINYNTDADTDSSVIFYVLFPRYITIIQEHETRGRARIQIEVVETIKHPRFGSELQLIIGKYFLKVNWRFLPHNDITPDIQSLECLNGGPGHTALGYSHFLRESVLISYYRTSLELLYN